MALILLVTGLLVGGMFLSGHTTPRLGIDLAGGTSITLSVDESKSEKSAINQRNLNTAVSIIERRVNGLGVSEAEVQTQGDRNIVVNIPKGTDERQAREQVGTTAQLYFRPVIAVAAGESRPQPSASPSADPSKSPGDAQKDPEKEPQDKDGEQAEDSDAATQEAPDPESSPQGRALTDGLKADETSSPDPGATKESPEAPGPDAEEDESAALQKKLDALDCTDPKQRAEVGGNARAEDSVVACGPETDNPQDSVKYALGPAAVDGTDVSSADAVFDGQRGQGWIVQMEFDDRGTKKFANVTEKLSVQQPPQNQFAIVLDGEVVSAPSVSERLGGGSAEISGSFNQESADELANILKYGALPLAFEEGTVTTISPTLGGEQLRAGLIAGGLGLLLVCVYLLMYYRALGLIAIVSLFGAIALTYPVMALLGPTIGFALSLPAVCGAIVAIGVTADSFIVYFERIRDEMREGRSLRSAVARAWPRARRTILVSDTVSLIAAVVLFIVSIGSVQGFAFVLGLTTVLDVVIVFFLTRPLLTIVVQRKFFRNGSRWSGLDPRRLGAAEPPPLRRRRPRPASADPKEA